MKSHLIHRFILKLLLIALFLAALPPNNLHADQTGRLGILLDEKLRKEIPQKPEVELVLYRIGGLDTGGGYDWKMEEGFTDYGVLKAKTTSEMVRIATKVAQEVDKKGAEAHTVTLSGGRAVLSELPLGIYLGVLKNGPAHLTVDPFILSFPAMERGEENRYDYTVTLKAVYSPPGEDSGDDEGGEDGKKPSPKPAPKPEAAKKTTTPQTKKTTRVRTGDENPTTFWALLMTVSLLGVLMLCFYKRQTVRTAGKRDGLPAETFLTETDLTKRPGTGKTET